MFKWLSDTEKGDAKRARLTARTWYRDFTFRGLSSQHYKSSTQTHKFLAIHFPFKSVIVLEGDCSGEIRHVTKQGPAASFKVKRTLHVQSAQRPRVQHLLIQFAATTIFITIQHHPHLPFEWPTFPACSWKTCVLAPNWTTLNFRERCPDV